MKNRINKPKPESWLCMYRVTLQGSEPLYEDDVDLDATDQDYPDDSMVRLSFKVVFPISASHRPFLSGKTFDVVVNCDGELRDMARGLGGSEVADEDIDDPVGEMGKHFLAQLDVELLHTKGGVSIERLEPAGTFSNHPVPPQDNMLQRLGMI